MRAPLLFLLAGSWADSIIKFFHGLGPFGFFLLEVLNASFLYLPLANELLMVSFVRAGSDGYIWALYVLMTALGAVVGVVLLDIPLRKAGERGLERFVKPKRIERLKAMLERHAGRIIFLASLLPPPFPFRVVILAASGLQTPRRKMLAAVFCGRLLRFTAEALLILYFGRRFLKFMRSDVFEYMLYACVAVGVVGSLLTLGKWFREAPLRPKEAAD